MSKAVLTIISGTEKRHVALDANVVVVGRCDCDVQLNDAKVSKRHARIYLNSGRYEVEDLDSRNGTFLNGAKVQRATLGDGDRLRLGNSSLFFHTELPGDTGVTFIDSPTGRKNIVLDALRKEILTSELDERSVLVLKRAQTDLAAIYRAGQIISSILSTAELHPKIMEIVFNELPAVDCCSLHLIAEGTGELVCVANRHRSKGTLDRNAIFSRSVLNFVLSEMKAVLSHDAQADDRFEQAASVTMLKLHSVMCVPLQSHNRLIGVVQACSLDADNNFDMYDLKLLTAIGMQAGTGIENAMLYEELVSEKAALLRANEKLRVAQESLLRSEKLAAVGQLAAGIAHDVKNPVFIIKGQAQLLQEVIKGAGLEEVAGVDVYQCLKDMEQGARHCGEIVNQMLQFARQSPPAKQLVEIKTVLEAVLSFLSHEFNKHRVSLRTRLADLKTEVMLDENQVKQTFINIVLNALQAMEQDGGTLEVSTSVVSEDGKSFAQVSFRDTGCGMDEEVRKSIFDPFFTTKKAGDGVGGSGLGLSVSYGIIQNHGGSIEVESTPGVGSVFHVLLPLHR